MKEIIFLDRTIKGIKTMEVVGVDNKDSEPLSIELIKKFNLTGNEALIFRTETVKDAWHLFAINAHQKVSTMKLFYYALNITGLNNIGDMFKAEFEDGNFEILVATTDSEVLDEAETYKTAHGMVMNIEIVDKDYNWVKTIF